MTTWAGDAGAPFQRLVFAMDASTQKHLSAHYAWFCYGWLLHAHVL